MEIPLRGAGADSQCGQELPPIDLSILAPLSGGDRSVEIRMLSAFRKSNGADAAALGNAIVRQDIAAAAHVSHRLLGASRVAGATALANVCEAIEQAALSGVWGDVAANGDAFFRELERINTYLSTLEENQAPIA